MSGTTADNKILNLYFVKKFHGVKVFSFAHFQFQTLWRKLKMTTKAKKNPVFIQKKNTIPRPICIQTAQKTVPVVGVHEKYGLIETYPGCYVKSYLIGDNNYLTAPEEE